MATIQEQYNYLKSQGHKIKVEHWRRFNVKPEKDVYLRGKDDYECDCELVMLATGGITNVYIFTPNGEVYEGEAVCSKKDQYNRREGRLIAFERALNKMKSEVK